MNNKIFFLLMIMTITSLFFIGRSITGLVISQSCCFGEDCDAEYLCDTTKDTQNDVVDVNLGVFFLLGSVSLYKFTHENKKDDTIYNRE